MGATNLNQNGMGKIMGPTILSESETVDLRERFKVQYAQSKGWDVNNLSIEQLNEIYSDKRWKNPGLLLS